MKKQTRIVALILSIALAVTGILAIGVFADETPAREAANAEITLAPNGAKAIASMTFDDGLMPTAKLLNKLCAEYGLEASLMLITNQIGTSYSAAEWLDVFAQGYLYPDSHSSSHKYLGGNTNYSGYNEAYHTEEIYTEEVEGSLADLKAAFPDYDTLTFAIPSSSYVTDAMAHVLDTFYAVRTGSDVVSSGKVQSLNPEIGSNLGQWHNTYVVRMQSNVPAYAETNSPANIVKHLEKCIANNGWFISITHGIDQGNPADMTEEQIREVFAAMKYYQDKGDLWVANFTDATKYVRERQGSNLTAETDGTNYYVNITLNDTTADGLPLGTATATNSDGTTRNVFNMPLTVKLEVSSDWDKIVYTQGTEKTVAKCFNEGNKTYAYVNVVPDGTEVTVSDGVNESLEEEFVVGSEQTPAGAWKPSALYEGILYGVWASEQDYLDGKAPAYWYQNADSTKETRIANDPKNPVGMYAEKITKANIAETGYDTYCAEYTAAGFIPGFVRLYQDTSTLEAFITGEEVQLVIDLGGHSLTTAHQWTIGDSQTTRPKASFTVKNGTFTRTGSSFYFRPEVSVLFENVVFNQKSGQFNTDGSFKLWVFDTCEINITNNAFFKFTNTATSPYQGTLVFKNTDLNQTSSSATHLFEFSTGYNSSYTSKHAVIFDKDCSITRTSQNWVLVSDAFYNHDTNTNQYNVQKHMHGLYFELGCEISKAGMPSYNMAYTYNKATVTGTVTKGDKEDNVYGLAPETLYANTDGGYLEVAVVRPTEGGVVYTMNTDSATATLSGVNVEVSSTQKTGPLFSSETFEANENYAQDGEWIVSRLTAGKGTLAIADEVIFKPSNKTPGITYAVWDSEESYLTGEEPYAWYTGNFIAANVGTTDKPGTTYQDPNFIPGYVRLYSDVKTVDIITLGLTQSIVIDLNGFTLGNHGFLVGGGGGNAKASLTIKNGNWNYSAGQNFVRQETTFIMENVHWTISHGNKGPGGNNFFYTFGADYARFTDCVITAKHGYLFKFNYQSNTGKPRSTVLFENTDIIYEQVPTDGMFYISMASLGNTVYDITFDAESSVKGLGTAPWVTMNEGYASSKVYPFKSTSTLTFEDGFASDSTSYPTSYLYNAVDLDASVAAGKLVYKTAVTNDLATKVNDMLLLTVTAPEGAPAALHVHTPSAAVRENEREATCALAGGYQNVVYCSECGEIVSRTTVTISSPAHTLADAVVENVVDATCTTDGSYKLVVYCTVCENAISSETVTVQATGHDFDKENKCQNCGIVAKVWTPAANSGIYYAAWESIDDYYAGKAPSYTFTTDVISGATIGASNSDGTTYTNNFKAGYVHVYNTVKTEAQFVSGHDQKLIINLDGNVLNAIGVRPGGSSGSHPNASLTIKNGTWNQTGGQNQPRGDVTFILENVIWNYTGGANMFYGNCADYTRFTNCTINTNGNFNFANGSASAGLARGQMLFENTDINITGFTTSVSTDKAYKQTLFFALNKNALFDIYFDAESSICLADSLHKGTNVDNYWFIVNNSYTASDLSNNALVFNFEEGFTLYEGMAIPSVSADLDKKVVINGAENINYDTYAMKAYDTSGAWVMGWYDAHLPDGIIGQDYLTKNGAKIVLFEDVTAGTIHTYSDYSLTIDLNGHKLAFTTTTNMQLGYSMSNSWKERVITFTSSNGRGTLDASKRTGSTFQARPGSIVLFENLDITFGANGFNDGGSKSITFRNCNVTGKTGNYVGSTDGMLASVAGNQRTYTFDNTTVNKMAIHRNWYREYTDVVSIYFKNGCFIDNSSNLVVVEKDARTINLNIALGTEFTTMSDSFVKNIAAASTVNVSYVDNETLEAVTNNVWWTSGDHYKIDKKATVPSGTFTTNLTLYSDFTLNFYADPTLITGVYYNGELLECEEWDGKMKYLLTGITPNTAANSFALTVHVSEGGETCYMPLNYSVVTYINRVLEGGSVNNGTKLVSAVLNYIKAAYAYSGAEGAPTINGVDYESQSAGDASAFSHSAISSVQLSLGSGVKVRFNLNPNYYGKLVVGDTVYEIDEENKGYVGAATYVTVNLRAFELYNKGIEVSDASGTATYTLANYVAFAAEYAKNPENEKGAELVALVQAIVDYSYYAREYKINPNN